MAALQNKTILIVSPQSWGKMFVSKHHYAVELAKYGNTVYFLNPPLDKNAPLDKPISIKPSGLQDGLFLIDHKLPFPYNIKFHFIGLFHFLMKFHIARLLRNIGKPIDIIWSFDLGNLYPFRLFPDKTIKIFHPVDEPLNQTAIDSAKGADIIFSVTREILDKYKHYGLPSHFINHGLAASFLQQQTLPRPEGDPIRVGLSGNFLRADIDRPSLLKIIQNNPDTIFECWGSCKMSQANISGNDDDATRSFIAALETSPNVTMHGAIPPQQLAAAMTGVDAFLICYDIEKDQSGGTNYHKIMEYLSTGKIIISNNVTTYKGRPELIQMVEERTHNNALPALFADVMNNLELHNSNALQHQRIGFARDNTYRTQVQRIEQIINTL